MELTDEILATSTARNEVERWENETLSKVIKRTPERKAHFEGVSLEPVNRLYTAADSETAGDLSTLWLRARRD